MAGLCNIDEAVRLLQTGQVVGLPTETVYGLGANALDTTAVAKVFEAKNRPSFDPLIVHVADLDGVRSIAELTPEAESLLLAFSPGPLTVVLKKKSIVPDLVTSGHPTVAVRIPAHPMMLQVLQQSGLFIAAPSANPFGYTSPTTAQHVLAQLGERIGGVLDGGPCNVGLESTIVDFTGGTPKVLRLGGMDVAQLELVLGELPVQTSSSTPHAPGMLSAHYNPGAKIVLHANVGDALRAASVTNDAAVLLFGPLEKSCYEHQYSLSDSTSYTEAAQNLFAMLRELGAKYPEIHAVRLPEVGLGRAINDRLVRAAATR
ncbi:MAG: threonylcarbamoyl-AMP synthase [Schleiferiaceae bacterium]|nr:threonylcarbamoyl-AMP synthase [Schleiferiaceae bacterium]